MPEPTSGTQQKPVGTRSDRSSSARSSRKAVRPPLPVNPQEIAATSAFSGRKAVSRGAIILIFYFWLLSGAIIFSWIARNTEFFPGDRTITRSLQKHKSSWLRELMIGISAPGFPRLGVPLAAGVAGIFWFLRFRLEAVFLVLSTSSNLLNLLVKTLIKRPRPTEQDLVTVTRVINQPSFPSGHVMHYMNLFGMCTYFLATNWRSGRLRNFLIAICVSLIAFVGPSRIYLGAHWPSDVMAGYVYGGLWFGGLMAFYLRVKAWLHTPAGKASPVAKPFLQPGDEQKEA